jgi:hypothetical protein
VADRYRQSMLSALWDFSPERFTSQALWDAFEQILPEDSQDLPVEQDPREKARVVGLVEGKTAGESSAAGLRQRD